MRRILFFADASSVHTRRWVQAIAAQGFDCIVATRRPAEVPGASEVISVRPGSDALGWFAALPEVRRLARRLAPQWVHGHYVTSYGLWAAASGLGPRVPVVLTAWGSDILVTPRQAGWHGRLMAAVVGWSLRRAALVTADSQDVLAEVRGYGTAAACEEVLWGADTGHFCPAEPAPGFGIVSLRNWEPNYNIDTLLDAFAQLLARRPDAGLRLELLGGGPDEAALRGQAARLGLGKAVRFTGRVGDAAMVAAIQAARVSVTVPTSDATSVSLLESLACGLPVVATDLPANRAWVDAAQRVPVRDATALAEALGTLMDDPALREALGQRNRALALQRASRQAQMAHMARLYEGLRPDLPRPVCAAVSKP
jgi:glycosyltransferase involved in cell wall biosynthesis